MNHLEPDKTKEDMIRKITEVFQATNGNILSREGAVDPADAGAKIFEAPLIKFASANDGLWEEYHAPDVIGSWFMGPKEWLAGAETVICFFLPFSEYIRKDNYKAPEIVSTAWLQSWKEGQEFVLDFERAVVDMLEAEGSRCCAPTLDERYQSFMKELFSSNWSERHAAFAAGLGTFSLSKGMITERGIAGRFGSVITDRSIEPDQREYHDIYEYCINCGACARRCPANAISREYGKNHEICNDYQVRKCAPYEPLCACGKCQTMVPCETGIPGKGRKYAESL